MTGTHRLLFVVLCALTGSSLGADVPVSGSAGRPFAVFDGLLYVGKPDSAALGMLPIRGINPPATENKISDGVNAAHVRKTLQQLDGYTGVVYLDYEMWPTFHASDADSTENIGKLTSVLQIAHETLPKARIGFYNVVPCWDYWGLVNRDLAKIRDWSACNDRIAGMANQVDVVMPSLYTFYDDPHGWDIYAAALLKAARRYNKPVYAFLWPEYHVSNAALKDKNLSGDFWRHELEFCLTRADGVVIWGGYQKPWDEHAAWWQETKRFLAELKPPATP